jgi:uncharacterized pyridoxal phosphate-containing UPF0001 family protein
MVDIEANLWDVQRRIAEAAGRAGRDPAEITLVAVTKTFTVDHVQAAYELDAIQLFDVVHSVDTLKLAKRPDRLCQREGRVMPILLEANVSGEEGKYGFALDRWGEDEEQRECFLAIVGGDTNPATGGGAGLDDHGSHRGRS